MTPISPERLRDRRKALTQKQRDIALYEQEMKRFAEDTERQLAALREAKQSFWRLK